MATARRWTSVTPACVATAIALTAIAEPSRAQRPPGADTMSVQAVAESLAVLQELRSFLSRRENRNSAQAWYHRGMIAWALYDRDRVKGGVDGLDWTLLGREADIALRTAEQIEPDNVRYQLTMGQYFLGTGLVTMRVQSYMVFERALADARASGDPALTAEAAVEMGRLHWRRYDPANYGTAPGAVRDRARDLVSDSALSRALLGHDPYLPSERQPYTRRSLREARNLLIAEFNDPSHGFDGEYDYGMAEKYFREAFTTDPSYSRGYRQLAMLLAERDRWPELAGMARTRVEVAPSDGWAWMSLGLASHRSGDAANAKMAFERGLAALSPAERARLDRIARVLRPRDSLAFEGFTASQRAAAERMYWLAADPLWSDNGAEPRAEFLSRVTYAELRWTVDELMARGADSDRGNVHIRYGPADSRVRGERGGESWWYDYARMGFHFVSAPTYGTGYFANVTYAYNMMDSVPARWDNIADLRIDTLPVNVARFRATDDAVDVLFAARLPVEDITAATDILGDVRTDFWMLRGELDVAFRDSVMKSDASTRTWTHRAPIDHYLYRLEAHAHGSLVAARTSAQIVAGTDSASGFFVHGFGISDVLLASSLEIPATTPARWRDVSLSPLAGPVVGNKQLVLLWENYDFGERDGSTEFDVAINIRRQQSAAGRITARIVGGIIGRELSDRVEMVYDRRVPHSPTVVEYITIDLGDTPTGTYLLSLDVTDRVTGRTASRTMRIAVR